MTGKQFDVTSPNAYFFVIVICIFFVIIPGYVMYEAYQFDMWEQTDGQSIKDDLIQQIHTGRSERGLPPVTIIETLNPKKVVITEHVDIDNPSTIPFENIVFHEDMKYLSITIHPVTVDTIKTSRTCTMTISGVW